MIYTKSNEIKFPAIEEFDFMIKYSEANKKSHFHEIELHTHSEFEIYINLSGDVSFLVENRLYPLSYGDVIIARPGEHHHCVYRSDANHKFFWILFDSSRNQGMFDFFLERSNMNFVSMPDELKSEMIELCHTMLSENLRDGDKFYYFLRLMNIIKTGAEGGSEKYSQLNGLPDDIVAVLEYIDAHISESLKVIDIANELYMSESTIERRFKEYLNITPLEFIRKKKLIMAAELLKSGESVLNAGLNVGFSDNSYFIKLFKKYYGLTPLQFKIRGN